MKRWGQKQVERRKFRAAIGSHRRCSLPMTLFESPHYVRISCLGLVCIEHRLDNRWADFNSAFELKLKAFIWLPPSWGLEGFFSSVRRSSKRKIVLKRNNSLLLDQVENIKYNDETPANAKFVPERERETKVVSLSGRFIPFCSQYTIYIRARR